jgi:insertion element IS1 protein InsB
MAAGLHTLTQFDFCPFCVADVTFYCTDHWKTYAAVVPADKLVRSKAHTHGIERNHCRQRHWFGRFKAIIISKPKEMVDLTVGLFARFRVNGDVAEIFTFDMIIYSKVTG